MLRVSLIWDKKATLCISASGFLAVKKEIKEELAKPEKHFKEAKSKFSFASKPKAKRKMITHESDSEKASLSSSYQKAEDNQYKDSFIS